jgi:glycogen synthase
MLFARETSPDLATATGTACGALASTVEVERMHATGRGSRLVGGGYPGYRMRVKPLRILYAAGPGDTVKTFQKWLRSEREWGVPDIPYSQQFLKVCTRIGAHAWIISANTRRDQATAGSFRVENRPIQFDNSTGIAFHIGRILYTLGLLLSAIRLRADVAVVAHGVHWFLLSAFPIFGIEVIPALHNTLWLPLVTPRLVERVLLRLARPLFASRSLAILSHPSECAPQATTLAGSRCRPIVPFIPIYEANTFAGIPESPPRRPPFRVMFAGRIEPEKGVFDLLEVARKLAAAGRDDIEFDICGTGSVLGRLRDEATELGLSRRFRCHGKLDMGPFRDMFGTSHVVVVPTRSTYTEGFNAVVAEGILAGRPVVTSRLCPAIDLVREAVIEVPPEDIGALRDAIVSLADDTELYESKRTACAHLKSQFLDWDNGWGSALERILEGRTRSLHLSRSTNPSG